MDSPPPLLLVKLAIPPELEPLDHVHQLVSDFLIPATIDGAVYNELQYILQVYGAFRPVTVGAMDGAAAKGRLDIMLKLHANGTEVCSTKAFVGAAANAHLEVLWWLNEFYASLSRPAEMVTAAAENGHSRVVEFLWRGLSSEELEAALVAAASKGHITVVKLLLPKVRDTRRARIAAARNNHAQMLDEII